MIDRRGFLAASTALAAQAIHAAEPALPKPGSFGIVIHSYGMHSRKKGFAEPETFLAYCRERGANGIQISLGHLTNAEAKSLRTAAEKHGSYVEGSIRMPKDKADLNRFEKELATSQACGASVVRTVLAGGRRYETFRSGRAFAAFRENALASLQLAEPILARRKIVLAVENHKNLRTDEMLAVMKALSSEWIGVCVDTGNNIALLERPMETIESLAPWARSCHLKDMAVEESTDGFLLSEVPLGEGILDLKGVVASLRGANPKLRFNLEMITRDPLRIPCLTDEYWITFGKVPGLDLARMLSLVKQHVPKQPLPRISKLKPADQLAAEEANVKKSMEFGHGKLAL